VAVKLPYEGIEEKYLSDDSTEIRVSRRSIRINKSKASIKFKANFLVSDMRSECFSYTKAVINCLIIKHDTNDSKSIRKVRKYFDWEKFKKTMKFEHDSLVENEIWDLIDIIDVLLDTKILIHKWVLKRKRDCVDEILKHKIRWMIHDYKQHSDLDFLDIFAIIIKSTSYKVIIITSIQRDWTIRYMNVVIVFLYKYLNEETYVKMSHDFDISEKVCKLRKVLYELKQISRVWYQIIQNFLIKLRFERIESNHDVFINFDMIIVIYVNNLLISESNVVLINKT
jgi:hypothetical protein